MKPPDVITYFGDIEKYDYGVLLIVEEYIC